MLRAATILATLAALATAAPAAAIEYAPVDRPGPPLGVPQAKLDAAVECSADVSTAPNEPVLLVPGTAANFDTQFRWNYAIALSQRGHPWCAISPPQNQLGDIQVAGEYDVY